MDAAETAPVRAGAIDERPGWALPEHERPIDAATVWTRYFVVLMFVVLAAWGLSDFSAATQGWLTLLLVAIVAMRIVARVKHERRLRTQRSAGLAALRAGNITRAHTVLDTVLSEVHRFPMLHAVLLADRALVDLREGRFETARGRLWAAVDSGWIPDEGDDRRLNGLIPLRYALCEGLDGRVDSAREWRDRAKEDLADVGSHELLTIDFVIAARSGDLEAGAARAEAGWEQAQEALTKDELRILGILIAFAREQAGADAGEAEAWFALLAPSEAEFLGRNWPEMRRFLRRHRHATMAGLLPGRATTDEDREDVEADDGR